MQTSNFKITGLTCSACAKLVKRRLEKIEGVEEITVLENGDSMVVADSPISKNQIKEALSGTDYNVV